MAESQVPYPYQPAQLQAIRASISEPRFATYLEKAGNHEEYALALYLYNARVAKAFLYPLSVVEVTLRNAVDEILVRKFGTSWHREDAFRNQTLTPEGLATLDKAIQRAGQNSGRDQVVATLTFDFWSNLFRSEYGNLWRTTVNIAFPNLVHGESRQDIQNLVKPINAFRNRVAHHEPVLDMNVTDIYAKTVRLVTLRCTQTAEWMKYHTTLNAVIRTRPKRDGGVAVPLASKLDSGFVEVKHDTTLMEIVGNVDAKRPAIVCTDDIGAPVAAFTVLDVTHYLSMKSKELDGLIALNEHRVSHMLDGLDLAGRWIRMDGEIALAIAIKELQKPRVQVLVGVDATTGKTMGTIVRAHRRY
ncbi:Abi family protein (plasmid) [Microvirga terrae]|uniref:Abi family protein n=1 Tax=Microvirga terrae TaxID=2740529 RepID=A0ABY5S0L1_9HYPH|nr:Abi family protein [Microvirga terrae]UVF22793.1 Abi family protein [Microvirga terrae]